MPLINEKSPDISEKFRFFFNWLYLFYPKSKGIPILHLLYFFVPQKILRLHGRIPWPVHPTSRILYWRNITVGNRCAPGMNAHNYIQARNGIILGNNLRIGPGVGLISASHSLDNYDMHEKTSPIIIGNNVWIGMNAVIMPAIKIGDNVIIGAGSIVTSDIPSDSVAAGNPCKVIREKKPYSGKDYSN